jgi:hypothetical protein
MGKFCTCTHIYVKPKLCLLAWVNREFNQISIFLSCADHDIRVLSTTDVVPSSNNDKEIKIFLVFHKEEQHEVQMLHELKMLWAIVIHTTFLY